MSFWRNDEDPPVKQTQVAITSTNGLSYTGGQRVDFQIPNNIELFDGRSCYLNMDVDLAFPAGAVPTRLQLDSTLGGQSLIKNIRIRPVSASRVCSIENWILCYSSITVNRVKLFDDPFWNFQIQFDTKPVLE